MGRRCLDNLGYIDRLSNIGRRRRRLNLFPLDRLGWHPLGLEHGRSLDLRFGWGRCRGFNEGDLDRRRGFFYVE